MTIEKHYKFITDEKLQEATKNFTTEEGAVIFNFNQDPAIMLQYGYKPLQKVLRPQNDRRYKITYNEKSAVIEEILTYLETQEEYEARKAQEERDRLDALTLTPADTWRALYKAKQMTKEQLLVLIEENFTGIDMNTVNIEFGASLYYRGAKLGNNKLFDVIGNLLGYTPADMDFLFEHKELPAQN